MSTRASGKPAAKQSAPNPATPYEGKRETKQDTIDRLRKQRHVLLSKKSTAAVVESDLREQVSNLQNQVGALKASDASVAKQTPAFDVNSLSKRVQKMQTAAESAISDQRARYRGSWCFCIFVGGVGVF